MARYKKGTSYNNSLPGLFDGLESEGLFSGVEPLPIHPGIEEEASRRFADFKAKPHGGVNSTHPSTEFFGEDDLTPLEVAPTTGRINFISFGSGSSGNCAYIGDEQSGLLIDAGIDDLKVISELQRHGISFESIKGIILTHDHSDHVRYVYKLVRKRKNIAVFCTPRTLNGMLRRHNLSNRIKDYHHPIYKEHPFTIGNFNIIPFEVMHDGSDNVGFYITNGDHRLAVATDLGCISERVDFYMRKANYLMIEANYDSAMLAAGSYPEYLKHRIRSDNGHLDNAVTAEYLSRIYSPALKNIFLCHLSKDNNTPEIALRTVERALTAIGVTVGDNSNSHYARTAALQLMALPRFDSTPLIALRKS